VTTPHRAALRRAGVPLVLLGPPEGDSGAPAVLVDSRRGAQRLLASGGPLHSLYASEEMVALGAMRGLQDGLAPAWEGQQAPTKAFLDELTRQVQMVLDRPLP
jgi:DNA-binding LacI/PurR family transcriptional regulator